MDYHDIEWFALEMNRYQCKEIEENNRMGKTRDLFKKIRDTMGTFHAKMGTIKDINGINLTEANDIMIMINRQELEDPGRSERWPAVN